MYDELTEVDIQKMKDEIDYRTRELRPKLIEEVKVARGFGDLSENFEYKAAKREKNRNDSRIRYLQRMVDTAKVISDHSSGDVVGLFDKVVIYIPDDDEEQTIRLVTTLRQNALEGLISKESPSARPSWATARARPCTCRSTRTSATTSSSAPWKRGRTTTRCPSARTETRAEKRWLHPSDAAAAFVFSPDSRTARAGDGLAHVGSVSVHSIGEHIAVCPCVVTLRKSDVRVAGRLAVIYILNLFWIKRDRLRVENESIIIRPIYFIEQLDRCHHVSDSRLVNII